MELMEAEHHVGEKNSVMESYLTLARYADNQYRRIERHLESSAFEAKRQHLQKTKVLNMPSPLDPNFLTIFGWKFID